MTTSADEVAEAVETEVVDPEQDDDEIDLGAPSAEESLRYFGVDFDVEGLVRRFERGELIIPRFDPEEPANENTGYAAFQRNFVWKKKQMDRFIESILLGYPIPGIFLVELKNRQYIVLDGQQRLTTLHAFYRGDYDAGGKNVPFSLEYVKKGGPFKSRTYETLDPADKRLFNNALIQATVVLPAGDEGKKAIYALFDRINSGGTKLNEQQIRVAIYSGTAVNMIREMNRDGNWRTLFGGPPHRDLKDQELILRYLTLKSVGLALRDNGDDTAYKSPLATFMTDHLEYLDKNITEELREREMYEFSTACALLVESVGPLALRRNRAINAARADSILAGLTLAIRENPSISTDKVRTAYESLGSNEEFDNNTQKSTSHRNSVNARLRASIAAFQDR
ncbi:DUF262 domain-containing protein [Amycolatopsis tucumanensis]|uniref:GmrSD restriction endonucleases N-terminal domain-containing protein n=1 Tax=Amycolatopsis tucumanensis TaxID=401106 RepID=A0ABP7I401_9PSEU|nr:DUF262 domain-containing protein [Amycolatopsis tucumanensis]MCF6425894.1 DUF262 domain-containing protein [Amycolatopsis tucumanensis]